MERKIYHNCTIVADGRERRGYVVTDGDVIAAVGDGEPSAEMLGAPGTDAVDLGGRMLMPGAIDCHVHFREPGLTSKGTIASESRAAVAGGVTSYIEMPNTRPATTTIEAWEEKCAIASRDSAANYGFFIGATDTNLPTLLAADYSRIAGVKVFMGSSTGGMLLDHDDALRRIFDEVDALIAVHAEDEATIAANREAAIRRYGRPECVPLNEHPRIRSAIACLRATRRAVSLARELGTRLHVTHISTAQELNLFTPGTDPSRKLITAETCPHYLIFDDSDINRLGARMKCNPAIKSGRDRAALRRALADGIIDTIATDHAPHLLPDKQGGALEAASGMPGTQFMLPLMLELLTDRGMTAADVARLTAENPAKVFGIERRGAIRQGWFADFAVVEKTSRPTAIADGDAESLCGWTPYAGLTTRYRVERTIVNGITVYRDGRVAAEAPPGCPLSFCPRSRRTRN